MTEGKISWKDSNLALIGSDLDKKIKQAAAAQESNWDVIGDAPGVKVWRMEQFKVVPWPEDMYGQFHTGDTYLVLNSWTVPGEEKLHHDLYLWIGASSSQDEYGTGAYKMVEADDYTGGIAVQHREVQGFESYKFKALFRDSPLTYLEGGIASGFNHVEPTVETPFMYRVKGTEKAMSLTQVNLSKSALNKGDSFILYGSKANVWVWHGESANPDEKARANTLAEKMCTEGTVVTMDQSHGDDDVDEFWAYLEDGDIQEAAGDDALVKEFRPRLLKVVAAGDDLELVAEGEKVKIGFGPAQCKLPRDALDEKDVFILDSGWEIFVWIGKDADRSEKLGAMGKADTYCKKDARTMFLPISFMKSGYETSEFEAYFVG